MRIWPDQFQFGGFALAYKVCVRINGHCSDINTKKVAVTYYTLGYVGREK